MSDAKTIASDALKPGHETSRRENREQSTPPFGTTIVKMKAMEAGNT